MFERREETGRDTGMREMGMREMGMGGDGNRRGPMRYAREE